MSRESPLGQVFGLLTVIKIAEPGSGGKLRVEVRCRCGRTKTSYFYDLKRGRTASCKDCRRISSLKHGLSGTPEYGIWNGIITRCENQKTKDYQHYGGRGIRMHPAWRANFLEFLRDVGQRPSPTHSIDRIDNDGNYEPGNVRWSTPKEQRRNRPDNKTITIGTVTKTIAQWSDDLGISRSVVSARLRRGWTPRRALGLR